MYSSARLSNWDLLLSCRLILVTKLHLLSAVKLIALILTAQVNPSTMDWPLQASLVGAGFHGPKSIMVEALTTSCYPLKFHPQREGLVKVN